MRRVIQLEDAASGHSKIKALWPELRQSLEAGQRLEIEVRHERRSTAQNARMWAMLTDVANQVVWHGKKLAPEDWKCIFTASLKKYNVVPGLDGGFVVVGQYTHKMTKKEHGELMDLIESFGAQHGVKFKAHQQMEN